MVEEYLKNINYPEECLLTVCIPVFNKSELFKYSLISLLQSSIELQKNNQFIDLLVVDDHSSEDVKKEFDFALELFPYPYSRYVRNSKNLGRSNNYENIIGLSHGKFVWVIGSDDFLRYHSLKALLSIIQDNSEIETYVLNVSHYDIDIGKLREFDCRFENISLFLDSQSYTNSSAPNNDIISSKLLSFIPSPFPSVYLGAVMTTIVKRATMLNSFLKYSEPKDRDKFNLVYKWYRNTYHLSMSFLDQPAYYISSPLVIVGEGTRDWEVTETGSKMESDYPLILFRVLSDIIELHRSNGLKYSEYLHSMNSSSFSVGELVLPIAFYGIIHKKLKYKFKEFKFVRRIMRSLFFPNFYLGVTKSIIKFKDFS